MKNFRGILSVVALVAGSASFASATSINVTCSTLTSATELSGNVVCPQLNTATLPAGAVVTDIIINLSGSISGSLSLTNNDTTPKTGRATTTSAFDFSSTPAGFTFPLTSSGDLIDASFTTGIVTVPASSTSNFPGLTSGVTTVSATDTTTFAPYEGTGSFNLPIITLTSLTSTFGGGNVNVGQVTNGTATAIVTYDYNTPSGTPEPTTMLLFGTGLVGMGLLRKRIAKS